MGNLEKERENDTFNEVYFFDDMRWIIGVVAIVILSILSIFYKNAQYSGSYKSLTFAQNYKTYFVRKNNDPSFVMNTELIEQYNRYCHEKGESCSVLPFQQLQASNSWLLSIQYVGSVVDTTQITYFYQVLDNLTTLSPYRSYPYVFGELLLPVNKGTSPYATEEIIEKSYKNTVALGTKGTYYLCDAKKLQRVRAMSDKEFFDTYKSHPFVPCKDYQIPSYLAFNLFQYMGDYAQSSFWYKVTSFDPEAPGISPSMVSIVLGRKGQHEDSMKLWFTQALSLQETLQKEAENPKGDLEKIKSYKDQQEKALKKAVYELQLAAITRHAGNERDIQKIIPQLEAEWQAIQQKCGSKKLDLGMMSPDKTDDIECYVFAYGRTNGFLSPLVYPFQKEGEKWVYQRDSKRKVWSIALLSTSK